MRRRHCLAALLACLLSPARAASGSAAGLATQVRAAYLFKFAAYVEWPPPEGAAGPLVVGVLGAEAMAEELERLSGAHQINQRAVRIRALKPGDAIDGLHMLYLGPQAAPRFRAIADSIGSQPVVTVTEAGEFPHTGSVFNFILVDERVRFEVSLTRAARSGLRISSRLLSVAYKIDGKQP